nr:hypothetical protein [Pirellula staleyi]
MAKSSKAEVQMDRRSSERRDAANRRKQSTPVAVEQRTAERRTKVARRRQIDPTTCERDYSGDEIEFMQALDAYKRTSGRMFPTCSEILEVIRALGYIRVNNVTIVETPAETSVGELPALPESIPAEMHA